MTCQSELYTVLKENLISSWTPISLPFKAPSGPISTHWCPAVPHPHSWSSSEGKKMTTWPQGIQERAQNALINWLNIWIHDQTWSGDRLIRGFLSGGWCYLGVSSPPVGKQMPSSSSCPHAKMLACPPATKTSPHLSPAEILLVVSKQTPVASQTAVSAIQLYNTNLINALGNKNNKKGHWYT